MLPGLIRPYHTTLAMCGRIADVGFIIVGLAIITRWYDIEWTDRFDLVGIIGAVFFMLFAERYGLYRSWRIASLTQELRQVVAAWLGAVLGLALVFVFVTNPAAYGSGMLPAWALGVALILCLWRVALRRILHILRRNGRNSRRVAIAGAGDVGMQLKVSIADAAWMGLRLVGFYDDRSAGDHRVGAGIHRVGTLERLVEDARCGRVDMVYVTLPLRAEARVNELVERLADTPVFVYLVPGVFVSDLLRARWQNVGDQSVVSVFESPFYGVDGWIKRCEDLLLAGFALALSALPMLLIAATIKLTSPGPVFYKQRRYGINGQEIEVWKFRTMSVCEDGEHVVQARRRDPRVTPVGAFLRHTSLDELPQFFNVLQGAMSVIGPRPHAVVHNEQYRRLIRGYMLRHKVKPGITGWAQVNGWRGETDTLEKMRKRVEYDLEYIRNWSLLFDLKIFLLTMAHAWADENAY